MKLGVGDFVVCAVIITRFLAIQSAAAQDWVNRFTTPAIVYWTSVASSEDGVRLVAVGNSAPAGASAIYTSTDSGVTWSSNTAPFALWSAVASSADGLRLAAVSSTGTIWTSTNAGNTWVPATSAPTLNWSSVASSADGARLVAAAVSDEISTYTNGQPFPPSPPMSIRANGSIYTSTDSGTTWRSNSIAPGGAKPGWSRVACSSDGLRLFAAGASFGLYSSTNGGTNWAHIGSPLSYAVSIAADADGIRLFASGLDDVPEDVWVTSTNAGATWNTIPAPAGGWAWRSIASSADGIKLVAADIYRPIYMSSNSGATWTTNNSPSLDWLAVASSAGGDKLVALARYGQIYTWQYEPTLHIAATPTSTVVSWEHSPFADGFILQQASSLSDAAWNGVALPVGDDGTNFSVTVEGATGAAFFRLRK